MKPSLTKKTSRRSIGGPSMGAASTPFQELSINEPALRPQAAPVSSFVQARSPNAPGPVVLSDPQLTPEPAEITNLQTLANTLGSLNSNLQQFATAGIQAAKAFDDQRRLVGETTSDLFQKDYPGQTFVQARDAAEKRAIAGDENAKKLFNYYQALSPMQKTYTERYYDATTQRTRLNALEGKIDEISSIQLSREGSIELSAISPDAPEFLKLLTETAGPLSVDPIIRSDLDPLRKEIFRRAISSHAERHANWKKKQYIDMVNYATEEDFYAKTATPDVVAERISDRLDMARRVLGIEGYQEVADSVSKILTSLSTKMSEKIILDNGNKINAWEPIPEGRVEARREIDPLESRYYLNRALEVFSKIKAGPNGEMLIDRLDPEAKQELKIAILDQNKKLKNHHDSLSQDVGEDAGEKYFEIAGLNDSETYETTKDRTAAIERATKAIENDPVLKNDPVAKAKALQLVNDRATINQRAFSKPVQDSLMEEASAIVNNPDLDTTTKRLRLDNLGIRGLTQKNLAPFYARVTKEDDKGNLSVYRRSVKDKLKKLQTRKRDILILQGKGNASSKELDGTGLQNYVVFFEEMNKERADNKLAIFSKQPPADFKGGDEAWQRVLEQEYKQSDLAIIDKYSKSLDTETQELPINQEGIIKDLDARMKKPLLDGDKTKIDNQLKVGRVLSEADFERELRSLLKEGYLSDSMRKFLAKIGYRNKVADYFEGQWKYYYANDLPENIKEQLEKVRIDSRDKGLTLFIPGRAIPDLSNLK